MKTQEGAAVIRSKCKLCTSLHCTVCIVMNDHILQIYLILLVAILKLNIAQ